MAVGLVLFHNILSRAFIMSEPGDTEAFLAASERTLQDNCNRIELLSIERIERGQKWFSLRTERIKL